MTERKRNPARLVKALAATPQMEFTAKAQRGQDAKRANQTTKMWVKTLARTQRITTFLEAAVSAAGAK
jgi:hypothetical protein